MFARPPAWYALCQAALCLAAAWAILSMYVRGTPVRAGEASGAPVRDPGLLWLGLAVAVWGLVGVVLLVPLPPATALGLRPFLSSANSACLLISASHLDYGVDLLQRARERPWWKQAALAGAFAVALLTLALYASSGPESRLAQLPDFLLSSLTLALYGVGLFRSFIKRGFVPLALLAALAVLLQFAAQLPEITDALVTLGVHGERRWMLNLCSKAAVLVAFLALAMTWVHELARRPAHQAQRLYFTGQQRHGARSRRRWLVRVGADLHELRERPHRDLLMLAVRRLESAADPDGGWLPLPELVGRLDDSRIRRLREDLRPSGLDSAIQSNFSKSYRLSLPPQHIAFHTPSLATDPELATILQRLTPTPAIPVPVPVPVCVPVPVPASASVSVSAPPPASTPPATPTPGAPR